MRETVEKYLKTLNWTPILVIFGIPIIIGIIYGFWAWLISLIIIAFITQ